MKFILILSALTFFFVLNSYSQTVEDLSSNVNTYELKEGKIIDVSSGTTLYELDGDVIKDGKGGKTLYKIIKGELRNASKKRLYKYSKNLVTKISTGEKLFEVTDSGVIKSWSMGTGFYRINGSFGTGELFMILLASGLL